MLELCATAAPATDDDRSRTGSLADDKLTAMESKSVPSTSESRPTVTVDLRSVHRRWKTSGYGKFWIELHTSTGTSAEFRACTHAAGTNGPEDAVGLVAEFATESPRGFVAQLSGGIDPAGLETWLHHFASKLDHAGFDGILRGAAEARFPNLSGYPDYATELSAFIGFSSNSDETAAKETGEGVPSVWLVPPQATTRICDHVASWTEEGGPNIILRRGTFNFQISNGAQVAPILTSAVETGMAGVTRWTTPALSGRQACLARGGEVILQVIGGTQAWGPRVNELRNAMTRLPELVDQAFVRPTTRIFHGWEAISQVQRLDELEESDLRYNKHLRRRHVPDAHGIQVLTDEHLAEAHDLSDWNVTDLGHGRHLVEAADLTPWYSHDLPDPATVTRARQDFGRMILTRATIEANPAPVVPTIPDYGA